MALLAFKHAYRCAGLELCADELPDHLAVVLEYAATVDPDTGLQLLTDHRAGIELLRLALEDVASPYVDVLRAVTATLPLLAGPTGTRSSGSLPTVRRPRRSVCIRATGVHARDFRSTPMTAIDIVLWGRRATCLPRGFRSGTLLALPL